MNQKTSNSRKKISFCLVGAAVLTIIILYLASYFDILYPFTSNDDDVSSPRYLNLLSAVKYGKNYIKPTLA